MSFLVKDNLIFGTPGYPSDTFVTLSGTQYSKKFSPSTVWSVQLQWTGTPAGTVTLWKSNKLNPSEANDDDWVQDTGYSQVYGGAVGKSSEEISSSGARWYRFKSVLSGSAGTLAGWVNDKPQER